MIHLVKQNQLNPCYYYDTSVQVCYDFTDNLGGVGMMHRYWFTSECIIMDPTQVWHVYTDLILDNVTLTLSHGSGITLVNGGLTFTQSSRMIIEGNLILRDSRIINNGSLTVNGGVILIGDSVITGNGVIN